jgi:hypothetical protein
MWRITGSLETPSRRAQGTPAIRREWSARTSEGREMCSGSHFVPSCSRLGCVLELIISKQTVGFGWSAAKLKDKKDRGGSGAREKENEGAVANEF